MAEHVLEEVVVLVPEEPLGGCGAVGSARKVVVDTGESFQVFCADMVCAMMAQCEDPVASFDAGGGPLEDGYTLLDGVGGVFREDVMRTELLSELSGELMDRDIGGRALTCQPVLVHKHERTPSGDEDHMYIVTLRRFRTTSWSQTLVAGRG